MQLKEVFIDENLRKYWKFTLLQTGPDDILIYSYFWVKTKLYAITFYTLRRTSLW